jgi:hypothetical protein
MNSIGQAFKKLSLLKKEKNTGQKHLEQNANK